MKRSLFVELRAARERKRPVAVVTNLDSGAQLLVDGKETLGDLVLDQLQLATVREAIAQDRSGKLADGKTFVQVYAQPPRMLVVGAVHVTQALLPMAETAGYEVIVIDPRRAWASEDRFPGVTLMTDWPDEAIKLLKPDQRSAIIVLTHDPKLDDPALLAALDTRAFYVGALGSKKTHAKRVARLVEQGLSDSAIARIHAPIGLPINAKSPAEIAISIMAQVTQVRRGGARLVRDAEAAA